MTELRLDRSALDRLLTRSSRARILVAGDIMLDEYVRGTVDRQSPEAPIPVLAARSAGCSLGGAANVARQLTSFHAHVDLAGVVGFDADADRLLACCRAAGVSSDLVVKDRSRTTTRKQRLVAGGRQIARVDWEDRHDLDASLSDRLLGLLDEMAQPDVIVLSDYAKGFLTTTLIEGIIRRGRRWGVPVLVDPAKGSFSRYRGATLIKANQSEFASATGAALGPVGASAATGAGTLANQMADLKRSEGLPSLVVTCGADGMIALDDEGTAVHLAAQAQEVFDVSGAGDTVMAMLALCRSWGEDLSTSAALANAAAAVVVSRSGVAVARPADLATYIGPDGVSAGPGRGGLASLSLSLKRSGRRVGFTNGCFDLLHEGHLHLLTEAAKACDFLVVGLNSDRSVARLKGPNRPFIHESERAAALRMLSMVDAVVVFDEDDPSAVIDDLGPDVLVKGDDYEVSEVIGATTVLASGGKVVLVRRVPGLSTTGISADRSIRSHGES